MKPDSRERGSAMVETAIAIPILLVMMVGMVLFWGLVILGIIWLLRETLGRHHPAHDPRAILDRRLAEGEISVEEYEQRKKTLGATAHGVG